MKWGDPLYNQMAMTYKMIFPVDEETLHYAKLKWKRGRILDLACGNGGYAIELAKLGFEVEGIDLSKTMIEAARESASKAKVLVNYSVADMADPLPENRYEGVLFIGNSLVHASSLSDVRKILTNVHRSLKPGGTLVMQILNYDRIMKLRPSVLPQIERDGVTFERRYIYEETRIRFQTVLHVAGNRITDEVSLLPLQSEPLKQSLFAAGFTDVELHDDFTAAPFDEATTFALVVVARKENA
jgi:glycine/sarcosine N-methyltransferase